MNAEISPKCEWFFCIHFVFVELKWSDENKNIWFDAYNKIQDAHI